jgi:uncharacterized protein (TIGR00369 family)
MAPSVTPRRTGVRIHWRCRIYAWCGIDRIFINHHRRRRYNDRPANHDGLGNDWCRLPETGMVEIALSPHPAISQQHGFVHAGAVSALADTAAGYAALTLMPADTGVLTTEFKINLLAPAAGERILARGRVVKAGRTLTLARAEVFANTDGQEKLIALLTATLMAVKGREDIND